MRDVYVIGAGQSPFGSFPERSYRELFADAYRNARESTDRPPAADDIDEAVVASLGVGGRQLGLSGPAVTEHVGLHNVPCSRIENACAAGGFAVRQGVQAIKSGMADVVLAGGYEVMSDMSDDVTKYWLGVSGETEWERLTGTTFAGVYAQMASAYLDEYEATTKDLSRVAVKNHGNGAKNPKAHLSFPCTLEDAVDAPEVAEPLNLYHCCPTSDGAAAVLLASEDVVDEYSDHRIRVAGTGGASDRVGLAQRDSYTALSATRTAAESAYEEVGFCEDGQAHRLLREGATDPDGELPVNTSGGLKSKGHPIGATGTGQVVEAFDQFTGAAGERQLDDPAYGLTHNVGGSGGATAIHIFEDEEVAR
jgi:acetyl-CoA C-acetyltransferase